MNASDSPEAERIARLLLRSTTAYLMPFDRSLNPNSRGGSDVLSRPKRIVRSTQHAARCRPLRWNCLVPKQAEPWAQL